MNRFFTPICVVALLLGSTVASAQSLTTSLLQGHARPSVQGTQRGTAPVNDLCSSVTAEDLAAGATVTFTGTTVDATLEGDYAQEVIDVRAVWHAITISECASLVVDFCGTTPAFTDALPMISPSCPLDTNDAILFSTATDQLCDDGNFSIIYFNVPPGTYYIPVRSEEGVSYGAYTMHVFAGACIDPPANDDCANAVEMTPALECNQVEGTVMMATQSLPPDTCSTFVGASDDDVWYSFVATSAEMSVSVNGLGDFDAVLAVYKGGCDEPILLACADTTGAGEGETVELESLDVGATYHYRVYTFFEGLGETPTFKTCVIGEVGTFIGEDRIGTTWAASLASSNDRLQIDYHGDDALAWIQLFDASGRVIHQEQAYLTKGQQVAIDLDRALAYGAYTVRLTANDVSTVLRVAAQ